MAHRYRDNCWGVPIRAAALLAALLVVGSAGDVRAADAGSAPSVGSSLEQSFNSPEGPKTGAPLELQLTLRHALGARARLEPDLEKSRWQLVDTHKETTGGEEGATTRWRLTFQIFRVGGTTLEPIDVVVTGPDGEERRLQTEPVDVRVHSVLPSDEEANFRDARPPATVWTRDYTAVWIGGGAAAVALFALLWFAPFRSKKQRDEPEPSRAPEEVALDKLDALRGSELVERGQHMIFYVRMSEAVRRFLGRRFDFPGTEWTTAEILDRLERLAEHYPLEVERIADWMHRVDLVKFSGRVPSPAEADEALEEAIVIVRETDPVEPEPPEEAQEGATDETDAPADSAVSPAADEPETADSTDDSDDASEPPTKTADEQPAGASEHDARAGAASSTELSADEPNDDGGRT